MDAIDFLNSDVVDLPKTRVGDYEAFVNNMLDEYWTHIQRVVNRSFLDWVVITQLSRVCALSDAIKEVIALSLSGDRSTAYIRLDAALGELGPFLRMLMPSGDMSRHINPMYRFRTAVQGSHHRGQLFHIPFYLRRIIKEMRYSVAGVPCLYLGGSTHVCWRELGQPDLAAVIVSRFNAIQNTKLKVLNFGHRLPKLAAYAYRVPQDFTGPRSPGSTVVAAQVACWPLVAACSIRVPDRSVSDRPEYIVPQLVLEWITRTHKFHGIRYFSTHYNEYPDDPKTYMNYVFPASTSPDVGYCSELCGLFELTNPVSWAHAKSEPVTGAQRPRYKTRMVLDHALESEFGRAEDGLLGLSVERLSSVPIELKESIRSAVEKEAYERWERDRCVHGRDWQHWFKAKEKLDIPENFTV